MALFDRNGRTYRFGLGIPAEVSESLPLSDEPRESCESLLLPLPLPVSVPDPNALPLEEALSLSLPEPLALSLPLSLWLGASSTASSSEWCLLRRCTLEIFSCDAAVFESFCLRDLLRSLSLPFEWRLAGAGAGAGSGRLLRGRAGETVTRG